MHHSTPNHRPYEEKVIHQKLEECEEEKIFDPFDITYCYAFDNVTKHLVATIDAKRHAPRPRLKDSHRFHARQASVLGNTSFWRSHEALQKSDCRWGEQVRVSAVSRNLHWHCEGIISQEWWFWTIRISSLWSFLSLYSYNQMRLISRPELWVPLCRNTKALTIAKHIPAIIRDICWELELKGSGQKLNATYSRE